MSGGGGYHIFVVLPWVGKIPVHVDATRNRRRAPSQSIWEQHICLQHQATCL